MYNEIKDSIFNNYLRKYFLYTFSYSKIPIINNIIDHSIFETYYDYKNNILTFSLGNDIDVNFSLGWEFKEIYEDFNKFKIQCKLINIK